MTKRVVNLCLIALLLGALAAPAVADGNPIPWPKTRTKPAFKAVNSLKLLADGNPIPWPKTSTKPTNNAASSRVLLADGNPIPWPSKPTAGVGVQTTVR
jgi:hypothetical protein